MRYRGTFHVPEQVNGTGLIVDLRIEDEMLIVVADGETVGSYPASLLEVERLSGDRFGLTLGDERFVFATTDPIGFSYEAMPYLERLRAVHRHAGPSLIERARAAVRASRESESEPESAALCVGLRSDGKGCGSTMVLPSGFCFAHDPALGAQREDIRERAQRAADRARSLRSAGLDDVVARLERAVAEVHEGRLDPQQALAMASLVQAMCDTLVLQRSRS